MADIELRFHRDMLVLSGALDATLAQMGYDDAVLEELCLHEPEALTAALRLQKAAGAQCLVTPTRGVTRARLAHARLRDHQEQVAQAALDVVAELGAQHAIAHIGPCALPLDASSAASLKTCRDEYAIAVRAFGGAAVDAFLFDGAEGLDDLRCMLMGARKVTSAPVFASVDVDVDGNLADGASVEEAAALMADLEADVCGIATAAPLAACCDIVRRAARACDLPVLVQLKATPPAPRQFEATPTCPYWHPDAMFAAADALRAAGAQFLRAAGCAQASYTGALVAATTGLDAVR